MQSPRAIAGAIDRSKNRRDIFPNNPLVWCQRTWVPPSHPWLNRPLHTLSISYPIIDGSAPARPAMARLKCACLTRTHRARPQNRRRIRRADALFERPIARLLSSRMLVETRMDRLVYQAKVETAALQRPGAAKAVASPDPNHIIILHEEGARSSEEEIQRQPLRPKQPKAVTRPSLRKGAMWSGITACSLLAPLPAFGFTIPEGGQ